MTDDAHLSRHKKRLSEVFEELSRHEEEVSSMSDEKLEKYLEDSAGYLLLQQHIKDLASDSVLKQTIVPRMFRVLGWWSAFVMVVVVLSGLSWTTQCPYFTFTLNPWFLGTLTSGVIGSILLLFMPILRGLFASRSR